MIQNAASRGPRPIRLGKNSGYQPEMEEEMSKYGHRNINWFEAIVNKLGGENEADRFLCGELTVAETVRQVAEQPIETVTVPDLPAEALLAVAKEQAGLTYLNPDYQKYGFVRGERGKTYEVLTWKSVRGVSSDAVREHFNALGFKGSAAAFISWVAKNHPEGWFVSIPEDDECFVGGGVLRAPTFYRGGSGRRLVLVRLAGDWGDAYVFVAFREIPQK